MTFKKTSFALGMACAMATATVGVLAQDDLDQLLNDLEPGKKPAAAAKAAPAAAPTAAVAAPVVEEKAEAKPEAKAEEKAEEKKEEAAPVVAAAPEAKAEEKVEEKKEEAAPVVAAAPEAKAEEKVEEKKEEAAPVVAEAKEEKKAAAPAPAPAAKNVDAQIGSFLDDLARVPGEKKAAAPAAAAPAVAEPAHPDAELISDLAATETLRRQALDKQAESELLAARAAMDARDWEGAARSYRLAFTHLNDRAGSREFKKECASGVAEAEYQAARQAFKEGNPELAKSHGEEALKLRHPRARAFLDSIQDDSEAKADKDVTDIAHRRHDKDYQEDRDLIRRRLRLSAQYMAVADLDKALEQCELVLRSDPYNQEAIALRDRIQRRRDVIIDKEREATRKGMIADVGAAWRPVYAINSAELKNVDGGTTQNAAGPDSERSVEQSIEKRMKEMMLPSITFKPPATISDAVDFFRQASKDYDRPDVPVDQRGFNFVLQLDKTLTGGADAGEGAKAANDNDFAGGDAAEGGAGAAGDLPQIPNISAANLSLYEALKLVCQVSGFKFKVQGPIVMVMPKDMTTDEFVTRSYNVMESFLDRMNSASGDVAEMKGGSDFGKKEEESEEASAGNQEGAWKDFFRLMGVEWPKNSRIAYIKAIGKLRVTNTRDNLAILEQALSELNVMPYLIEIETRFVEVAQEDLNSLGFEWLLNSDYSFNVGGKVAKALNLKDGEFNTTSSTSSERVNTMANGGMNSVIEQTTTTGSTWSRAWHNSGDFVTDKYGNKTQTGVDANGDPVYQTYAKNGYHSTGKNMAVNAVNGTDYSTNMRYLNSSDSHITKSDGTQYSDQFMKVNAFLGNADLSMILHMLSQRNDTDLLSAPKVVTKSGEEATMKVVTEYIYPTDYDVTIQSTSSSSSSSSTSSSGSGGDGKILPMVEPQTFTMREVGVILQVTPDLSPENQMINLTLHPQIISEPTWKDYGMKVPMSTVMSSEAQLYNTMMGNDDMQWFNVPMEQPFFKVRSIETKISIYNGATVVMGGLITEDRKSMEDKIPFLGDIPFVGRFFRSRSEWSDKRNLLLFVTARLVDPRGRQMSMGSGENTESAAAPAKAEEKVTPAPEAK